MEQIVLTVTMQLVWGNQRIRPIQHKFMKGRSCLTDLKSFYDQVACLE